MQHGLNTEKERNSYAFGKRGDHGEDTKALSLATRRFTWKVSFGNPCSIRGSPENLVENEGFLLVVPMISRIIPGQVGFFEVKKQGHFQAGNVDVAEHLRNVSIVEGGDQLEVDNDYAVHDEVRHQSQAPTAVRCSDLVRQSKVHQ